MARSFTRILGGATAIAGAVLVVFPSVEMYYQWTGRMQADMETLSFPGARGGSRVHCFIRMIHHSIISSYCIIGV